MKISQTPVPGYQGTGRAQGTAAHPPSMFSSALETARNTVDHSPVLLGTITRETPTVSQLLFEKGMKKECWQVIHDKVNSGKPFHRIAPGTQIHYDPGTRELMWGRRYEAVLAEKKAAGPGQCQTSRPGLGEPDLSQAARRFLGTDYEAMDCYELLVEGLEGLGVQYAGKGGLYEYLVTQAREQGLPGNHFLNGEGVVSASGTDLFRDVFYPSKDPEAQAEQVMARIGNMLETGQILSFSMKNRGHTGIISERAGKWTFINSGRMDHNLAGENGKKAVGEEALKAELINWLTLAKSEKTALQISLGRLDRDRLSMFRPQGLAGQKV